MSRKHYTLIRRQEIRHNSRFVIVLRTRHNYHDFVFFSGRRISGTNKYIVCVYDRCGDIVDRFSMVRTHGRWQILKLAAIRNCEGVVIARFYWEVAMHGVNDLGLVLSLRDPRSYITVNEAAIRIAQQRELPKNVFTGLRAAVMHAAAGGECR